MHFRIIITSLLIVIISHNWRCSIPKWRINGNSSKPHMRKMHNVQETQKKISKQTRNRVFVTSIFAIFIDFALEF